MNSVEILGKTELMRVLFLYLVLDQKIKAQTFGRVLNKIMGSPDEALEQLIAEQVIDDQKTKNTTVKRSNLILYFLF